MIIGLVLFFLLALQSCAVTVGSDLADDEENAGAGAVGLLVALLFLVAAAFVLAKPRFASVIFGIAAALALLGAAGSDFTDLYAWATAAAVLAGLSFFGFRAKRAEDAAREAAAPRVDIRPTKTCPDCAETVLADANVCRHCGYRFDRAAPEPGS